MCSAYEFIVGAIGTRGLPEIWFQMKSQTLVKSPIRKVTPFFFSPRLYARLVNFKISRI